MKTKMNQLVLSSALLLAADTTVKVYVVGDIPAAQADGDVTTVDLEGTILKAALQPLKAQFLSRLQVLKMQRL